MKLHITNQNGVWTFDYESEPMPKERFDALIALTATLIVAFTIVALFSILAS